MKTNLRKIYRYYTGVWTDIYIGWKCLKHTIIGLVKLLPSPTCHRQTSPSVSLTQHWKKTYTRYWKTKHIFFWKTGFLLKNRVEKKSVKKINLYTELILKNQFWDIYLPAWKLQKKEDFRWENDSWYWPCCLEN